MPFDGVRSGPLVCTDHSVRMILRDIKVASRRGIQIPKAFSGMCRECWMRATPRLADDAFRLSSEAVERRPYLDIPGCKHLSDASSGNAGGRLRSPYGTTGDQLWIRESCRELEDGSFAYRADHSQEEVSARGPWKNVRFVPKRSARIWLEVLEVRVEHVQEITPDDVVREGVCLEASADPVSTFAALWDEINGRRGDGALSWARNPWVWRILFRRMKSRREG